MKKRIYFFFSIFSFLLLSIVLVFHFHIKWLPFACLVLGILTRVVFKSSYLAVFSFLIPILPAFAVLENKGFPLNYLLLPVFFLCGIMAGDFSASKGKISLPELPKFYFSFLLLLGISFIFVMLRWSNLTLSFLAFFKDTPVAPVGQRLSFGIIFPVVELALFTLSPFYFLLLRRLADRRWILIAFLSGQSLSTFYSLFQRWQGRSLPDIILNGLASDPTAFGFLSALAILMAWYLYFHYNQKWLGILFAFISLIGILNSATRIGFFTLVAAIFLFIFSSRKKIISIFLLGILLAGSLIFYIHFFYRPGTNFFARLKDDFVSIRVSLQQKKSMHIPLIDASDPRNILWHYSRECLRDFPVTGVGPGNFVFWVMGTTKGVFYHHLPANQYFFITSSTGLLGLLVFLLFCFGLLRFKKRPEKWLLKIFLFLLIFNDYLWFPEIFLVFWLFASLGENSEEKPLLLSKRTKILYICGFLVFIFFNLLEFSNLHPKNWARINSTSYDYGFSYQENENGRKFRWTGEKAGIYTFLDKNNPRTEYRLFCGAPLLNLPDKKQAVDIYWRGKFFRQVAFRQNIEVQLLIEDKSHSEGFLEFRVHPAFNLKKMGLGEETRSLGIQVSGPGI
jgi:O-antigen ligase